LDSKIDEIVKSLKNSIFCHSRENGDQSFWSFTFCIDSHLRGNDDSWRVHQALSEPFLVLLPEISPDERQERKIFIIDIPNKELDFSI